MILVYSVLQGKLQRTSFSSRDTWYIWNQTCFVYREFWLFSGNSKHCRHDADPECLCGPLQTRSHSGCKSDFSQSCSCESSFTLGFPLLKLPRDALVTRQTSVWSVYFYCAWHCAKVFPASCHFIFSELGREVLLSPVLELEAQKSSVTYSCSARIGGVPFMVQILTTVLLTFQK